MSLMAEVELGMIYLNTQEAIYDRPVLQELGHP